MPDGGEFDPSVRDSDDVSLGSLGLKAMDAFEYVFDLGDDWSHRCTVQETNIDPIEAYGEVPPSPVVIWGWGTIPDQYGRLSSED
jgi:hypothetical protein